MFLLPGLVIGSYAAHMSFLDEERLEMIRYLFNRAHPDDGGWGLYVFPHVNSGHELMCVSRHIEGPSTAMGTGLNYVTLRLLGVLANHPVTVRARSTLHKLGGQNNTEAFYAGLQFLGGTAASASWAKFWLSILNVYDWEGNNPIPPEIWCVEYTNQPVQF
jgi:lanosterol synthase